MALCVSLALSRYYLRPRSSILPVSGANKTLGLHVSS